MGPCHGFSLKQCFLSSDNYKAFQQLLFGGENVREGINALQNTLIM
jgi:hypothetical protein